jgi:amino acid permease
MADSNTTGNSHHQFRSCRNLAAMSLKRELGVFGATMMGLGSIIGTGVFISIGIAAGIAGPAVVIAIAIAAAVATCNALNSAQLAANHPVSAALTREKPSHASPSELPTAPQQSGKQRFARHVSQAH